MQNVCSKLRFDRQKRTKYQIRNIPNANGNILPYLSIFRPSFFFPNSPLPILELQVYPDGSMFFTNSLKSQVFCLPSPVFLKRLKFPTRSCSVKNEGKRSRRLRIRMAENGSLSLSISINISLPFFLIVYVYLSLYIYLSLFLCL